MSPLNNCLPVYVVSCLKGQWRLLHLSTPPRIVTILILVISYTKARHSHMHTVQVKKTIQHIVCTGYWSWYQCHGGDQNLKYCSWSENRTHISRMVNSNQWLKYVNVSLPSHVPGIIKIRWGMVRSVSQCDGLGYQGCWGPGLPLGQHSEVTMIMC